jgi:hypothetical protein
VQRDTLSWVSVFKGTGISSENEQHQQDPSNTCKHEMALKCTIYCLMYICLSPKAVKWVWLSISVTGSLKSTHFPDINGVLQLANQCQRRGIFHMKYTWTWELNHPHMSYIHGLSHLWVYMLAAAVDKQPPIELLVVITRVQKKKG